MRSPADPATATRSRRFTTIAAILATAALLAVGCSKDDAAKPDSTGRATSTAASATTPTTALPIPDHRSFIATALPSVAPVSIFDSPGGALKLLDLDYDGTSEDALLPNPLPSSAPATFLVKAADQTSPDGELFHEVYLPTRPNGITGFVRAADVTVSHTDLAITIDLSDHTLILTDAGVTVETFTIAAGAADTPTPTGTFFVKELLEPTDPDGAYGPLAYGLSAYSEVVLDTEAFADGVIGIHGTNRPELLGTDVSHGCVRISNEDVLRLEALAVPLGMIVTINA